jgi:hypothetical protein
MFKFKEGSKVKFKTWGDYISRKLNPWTWLTVVSSDDVRTRVKNDKEEMFFVDTAILQPPLGYQDVYEVCVPKAEDAEKMLGWVKDRGGVIAWTSLDLGTAGRFTYTPADAGENKPHWSMGIVETVKAASRLKFLISETVYEKPKDRGWSYDRRGRCWWRETPYNPKTATVS